MVVQLDINNVPSLVAKSKQDRDSGIENCANRSQSVADGNKIAHSHQLDGRFAHKTSFPKFEVGNGLTTKETL